ncbi:MAG: hypothetical protein R2932_50675 [Caldilineaceae bacterium]
MKDCFGRVIYAPDAAVDDSSKGKPAVIGILIVIADMDASIYQFLNDWNMGETGTAVLSQAEAGGTRILNQVRYDETKPLERFAALCC